MSDLQRRDQKSCSALIGYASPLLHMTPCDVVDVKVESSITDDNMIVDDTTDELRKICINISDKSFTGIPFTKYKHTTKASRPQEWFDNDCKKAKQEINKKRKSYQEALRDNFSDSETKSRENCYFQELKNFNAVKEEKSDRIGSRKKNYLEFQKSKIPKNFGTS